jgi:hypothetical protein
MPLPTTPQFEEEYLAFVTRYAPGNEAAVEKLEFIERLHHVLELAARDPSASDAALMIPPRPKPADHLKLVQPDASGMGVRNAGWIARLKLEEEMGGTVPWPISG